MAYKMTNPTLTVTCPLNPHKREYHATVIERSYDRRVSVPLKTAIRAAVDAIAVHASLGMPGEARMLKEVVRVICNSHDLGVPVIAAIYDRSVSINDAPDVYAKRAAHAARIALELGADVVKASYTGDPLYFKQIVRASSPLPVLVAGGPYKSDADLVSIARNSLAAGAAGCCFGRGLAYAKDLKVVVQQIKDVCATVNYA